MMNWITQAKKRKENKKENNIKTDTKTKEKNVPGQSGSPGWGKEFNRRRRDELGGRRTKKKCRKVNDLPWLSALSGESVTLKHHEQGSGGKETEPTKNSKKKKSPKSRRGLVSLGCSHKLISNTRIGGGERRFWKTKICDKKKKRIAGPRAEGMFHRHRRKRN